MQNISVLVIDDDTWMQRVLTKIFSRMDIHNVFTANNGFEGINLAVEQTPDIIFLDLIMPELSGIQTLKVMKTLNCTKKIPIIIITANSDVENFGAVISSGASEFVAKPFTYTTIMEKLEKVIGQTQTESNEQEQNDHCSQGIHSGNDEDSNLKDEDFDFFNTLDISNVKAKSTKSLVENEDLTKKYKKDISDNTSEIKKILNTK